jgi:hypothetical protein
VITVPSWISALFLNFTLPFFVFLFFNFQYVVQVNVGLCINGLCCIDVLCIDWLGCIDVLSRFCELIYLVSIIYFSIIMSCKNIDAIRLYLSYLVNYSKEQSPS